MRPACRSNKKCTGVKILRCIFQQYIIYQPIGTLQRANSSSKLSSKEKIARILKMYGEETFAKQIARNIVKYRANKPLKTCGEFAEIIRNSIPAKFRYGAPCERKSFQALRIEVNGELDGLYELVLSLTRRLKKGGRIVILTFQSLEDRIVKEAFKSLESPCTCPASFPVCVCGKKPEIKIITKKPITASEEELQENSRSKCAKLRIAERII